jgi:hypothetical protein
MYSPATVTSTAAVAVRVPEEEMEMGDPGTVVAVITDEFI